MMMLLQQDKDVENQRRQEHIAHAADHAAESMRTALSSIENLLGARPDEPSKFPSGLGFMSEPKASLWSRMATCCTTPAAPAQLCARRAIRRSRAVGVSRQTRAELRNYLRSWL